jgi:hypothetical protein
MGGAFYAFTYFVRTPRSSTKEDLVRPNIAIGEKITRYLDQNIFFDIMFPTSWTNAELECAVKENGADHILFGGSYPVTREWLLKGAQKIQGLDISDREKKLILGENMMKLFNIRA